MTMFLEYSISMYNHLLRTHLRAPLRTPSLERQAAARNRGVADCAPSRHLWILVGVRKGVRRGVRKCIRKGIHKGVCKLYAIEIFEPPKS